MARGSSERNDAAAESAARSLPDAAAQLGARALDLAATRLELASVELAIARERLFASLLLILAAFGCALLALLCVVLGIVAYFWDTARFTAMGVVILVFALATGVLWHRFAATRRDAPAPLASTAEALRRDAERLAGRGGESS